MVVVLGDVIVVVLAEAVVVVLEPLVETASVVAGGFPPMQMHLSPLTNTEDRKLTQTPKTNPCDWQAATHTSHGTSMIGAHTADGGGGLLGGGTDTDADSAESKTARNITFAKLAYRSVCKRTITRTK